MKNLIWPPILSPPPLDYRASWWVGFRLLYEVDNPSRAGWVGVSRSGGGVRSKTGKKINMHWEQNMAFYFGVTPTVGGFRGLKRSCWGFAIWWEHRASTQFRGEMSRSLEDGTPNRTALASQLSIRTHSFFLLSCIVAGPLWSQIWEGWDDDWVQFNRTVFVGFFSN